MPDTLAQRVRSKYPGVYDDLSDAELDAKVRAKYPGVYDDIPKSETTKTEQPESDSGAVVMRGAAAVAPAIERGVVNFATSPNVPKMAAKAGRIIGGAAPVIGGAVKMGPAGAAIGAAGAAQGAWAGGKAGWFTGKLAQNLLMPVARAAEVLAPYAQALSTLSGAQGVLDLAQMAEPNRKDIGFFGVGKTQDKAAQKAFSDAWDNWMATYPRSVGKERWSALKPSERKEAFDQFMQTQTKAGNE